MAALPEHLPPETIIEACSGMADALRQARIDARDMAINLVARAEAIENDYEKLAESRPFIRRLTDHMMDLRSAASSAVAKLEEELSKTETYLLAEGFAPIHEVTSDHILCGEICPLSGYEVVGFFMIDEEEGMHPTVAFKRPNDRSRRIFAAAWLEDIAGHHEELTAAEVRVRRRLQALQREYDHIEKNTSSESASS